MPETSEKILKELNTVKRELSQMDEFGRYPSGNKVTEEPEVLFARLKLDDVMKKVKVIQEEQKKAVAAKAEPEKEEDEKAEGIDIEPKAEITYDDFAKLQFQVGVILSCEAVPKSKKLLCSQVQVGSKVRQIISGIKHSPTGGDGRQESHGCDQLKTGEIGRSALRGHDFVCRGCRRKAVPDDNGEKRCRRVRRIC